MADPQCSDRQMSDEEQPEAEQPRISPIFGGLNVGGRGFGREPIIPPGLADIISQVTPIEYEAPDFVIDDSHWRAADAAEETAATVGEMRAAMEAHPGHGVGIDHHRYRFARGGDRRRRLTHQAAPCINSRNPQR